MKHLKKFNESKIEDSIMDLCNDYLVYLKDVGFSFSLREYENIWYLYVSRRPNKFTWKDIKYDFIPFLEVFMKHYIVSAVNIHTFNFFDKETSNQTYIYSNTFNSNSSKEMFTIDDLFKDNVTNRKLIRIDIEFKSNI